MSNPYISRYIDILNNKLIYFPIQGVLLTAQTLFFAVTIKRFKKVFSPQMQAILILFQVLLTVNFLFNLVIIIIFNKKPNHTNDGDEPGRKEYEKIVLLLYSISWSGSYVYDRISIIILFQFLQFMKYAQLGIQRQYTSLQEILNILKQGRALGRSIITVNILAIVSLFAFQISRQYDSFEDIKVWVVIKGVF